MYVPLKTDYHLKEYLDEYNNVEYFKYHVDSSKIKICLQKYVFVALTCIFN